MLENVDQIDREINEIIECMRFCMSSYQERAKHNANKTNSFVNSFCEFQLEGRLVFILKVDIQNLMNGAVQIFFIKWND